MDNVTDFTAKKRERDMGNHPTRLSDMAFEIWLDADGNAEWSCTSFARASIADRRIDILYDAVFEELKIERPEDKDRVLYQIYSTNSGKVVRMANTFACTDTRLWHAWRIMRMAIDDFKFLTKLAWKAWRHPIKSSHASAAVQTPAPQHDPD